MGGSAVEYVRRFYDQVNRADHEAALRCLDPDVEWVVPAETSFEPGVFRGHEDVRHDFERFSASWSEINVEMLAAHTVDDERVAVHVRWFGVAALSGVPVEMHLGGLWEIRDGLITRFEHFPSFEAAIAAAAQPAPSETDRPH